MTQQLNFLTTYEQLITTDQRQPEFWNQDFSIYKEPKREPNYREVAKFFNNLDYSKVAAYTNYWQAVRPKSGSEVFQRWLFAFLSVHTSWERNIVGYNAIKDWWVWLNRWDVLLERLVAAGVGMHNQRVKYISEFAHKFWEHPADYQWNGGSWTEVRNRLKDDILGLGMAKVSFALEMIHPSACQVTCFDTHMFQAYALDQTKDARLYTVVEDAWVDMCRMWGVPPYIARCLYWDTKQGHVDSRYWSYVFEKQQNHT